MSDPTDDVAGELSDDDPDVEEGMQRLERLCAIETEIVDVRHVPVPRTGDSGQLTS